MPLTNPLFATYGRTPENNKRIFSSMRPQTSFEMSRMSGSSPQMASHSKRVVPWEVPPTHNPKGMTHDWRLSTEQRRASNLAKNNARSRRTAIAVGTRCSGASCPERTGCASSTSGTRAGASGVDTGRSMDADGSSSDDCRREVLICMSGGFLLLCPKVVGQPLHGMHRRLLNRSLSNLAYCREWNATLFRHQPLRILARAQTSHHVVI